MPGSTSEHGRVDGLVNNAGDPFRRARSRRSTLADWDRVLGDQPHRAAARHPDGRAADGRRRLDRQHQLGRRARPATTPSAYTVSKWGVARAVAGREPRARPARDPRQHDLPGLHRDADDRLRARRLPRREHRRDTARAHRHRRRGRAARRLPDLGRVVVRQRHRDRRRRRPDRPRRHQVLVGCRRAVTRQRRGRSTDGHRRDRARRRRRRAARPRADARAHLHPPAGGAAELRARLGRELLGRGGARRRRDREADGASGPPASRRSSTRRSPVSAATSRASSASTPRSTSTSSSRPACTRSSSCRTSSRYRSPRRSPRSSSARSARGSTTPASRPRFLKCAVEQHGLIGDVPRILAAVAAAASSRPARR